MQRIDSDIAEKVMVHFANLGIPILPLHDSFIMHNGYESWLRPVMMKAFKETIGIKPKIDAKESKIIKLHKSYDPDDLGDPISLDIEDILANEQSHDKRLHAFFSIVAGHGRCGPISPYQTR